MTAEEFLKITYGKKMVRNSWNTHVGVYSFFIPSYVHRINVVGDMIFRDGKTAKDYIVDLGYVIGSGTNDWSYWTSPAAVYNPPPPKPTLPTGVTAVTTTIGQLTEDFLNKYKLKKMKRSSWKKDYVVPQGPTMNDNEFFGELYGVDGKFRKADTFYISDPLSKGDWIEYNEAPVDQFWDMYPPVSSKVETGEKHKCHCKIRDVWAEGCKCGGV